MDSHAYVLILARVLASIVFLLNGFGIISQARAAQELIESGAPARFVPYLMLSGRTLQVVAGLALAFGIYPRIAAVGLLAFLIPATFVAHSFWKAAGTDSFAPQLLNFCKNTGMAGGLLFIAATRSQPTLLSEHFAVDAATTVVRSLNERSPHMIKSAEINQRLLEDLPVIRLPKCVPPGDGLSIWWMGDDKITFQATSADTSGAYTFWVDEPPGHVGPPKHVHSREEEGFYVIDGQVEFRAGDIESVVTRDTFVALPKGIPHSWVNTSTGHARLITFTAGAGNEGFFLTLGAPGVGPAGPRATLPLEEINARTRRYGVTYMETTDNPMDGALEIGAGRSPTIVGPDKGEQLRAGGVVYSLKGCGSATAGAYTLIEVHIEPGGIMPSHRHAAFEEGVYVLDGTVRANLDGEAYEATAGSFLIIPWGLPHEIRNTERNAARLLLLSVPGGVEDYYRAACSPSARGQWQVDLDADLVRLRTVGLRFGIFE